MALPPLVEPADELSIDEVRRYSRHLIIPDVGMAGQKRLKNARVLVIGAGGLGSPALLYLAAAGIGTLGIVDFDTVDESNLQRQIIHGQSDIGKSKAESAKESIAETNPLVNVVVHDVRLDNDNVMELFRQYDLIIDGTDNFATRYMVNDAAVLLGKPYVWAAVLGSTAKSVSSGPSTVPAIAAFIQNLRRRAWCRAAPRAVCSAYFGASVGATGPGDQATRRDRRTADWPAADL